MTILSASFTTANTTPAWSDPDLREVTRIDTRYESPRVAVRSTADDATLTVSRILDVDHNGAEEIPAIRLGLALGRADLELLDGVLTGYLVLDPANVDSLVEALASVRAAQIAEAVDERAMRYETAEQSGAVA